MRVARMSTALLAVALAASSASAQAPPDVPQAGAEPAAAKAVGGVSRKSVLSVFRPDNPMLWPLALCSIVTVGFTLERTIALRRGRVVPKDFVARFTERLASGKLDKDRAA